MTSISFGHDQGTIIGLQNKLKESLDLLNEILMKGADPAKFEELRQRLLSSGAIHA
jgi:hypothetical protein